MDEFSGTITMKRSISVGGHVFELGGLISHVDILWHTPSDLPVLSKPVESAAPENLAGRIGRLNPCQIQRGPSCGGNAAANAIELLLRSTVPEKVLWAYICEALECGDGSVPTWQIDGNRIWSYLRNVKYGNEDGGMTMDDIEESLYRLGLIPGCDVISHRIGANPFESEKLDGALAFATVSGLAVASSWEKPEPNGYIRAIQPWPNAGHAVHVVGEFVNDGERYIVIQNSWGDRWGWHGLGILNERYYKYSMLDRTITIVVTKENWWEHSTWIEFVVPHDQRI
jgi:hypothetical protein